MNDEKPLTGVRKRAQIASANKQMFIWVAVAAIVVSVCVVLAFNFGQRIIYQFKVNGKLGDTSRTLKDNLATIDTLTTNVNKLNTNQDLNLPNLKSDSSTPLQVVLDALPTENDQVSLGASLQQNILASSGVTIQQISVTGSSVSAAPATTTTTTATNDATASNQPTAQPIAFNLILVGNYDNIQKALQNIEKTIRPITINNVNLQGTDNNLQATISATTYYVPKVNYQLGSECVPAGDATTCDTTGGDAATTTTTTGGAQ